MKVILLQDVAKIGRKSQIVDVSDGYARNQLIPKRMAEAASTANTKRIEKKEAEASASNEAGKAKFSTAIEALRAITVKVMVDANEKGHMFKAVAVGDVVNAARENNIDIDDKMISFVSTIKEVGEHTVKLVLGSDKADFTIEVIKK